MSRPSRTLILLAGNHWARADVERSGSVSVRQGWLTTHNLDQRLEEVLTETGVIGRAVWVLSNAVWLGEVYMPPSAVIGLADSELNDAASFEAEAAGGLSALESVTSAHRIPGVPGEDRFLVAQLPREELARAASLIKRKGGALAGVIHPAGLPQRLDVSNDTAGVITATDPPVGSDATDWVRTEFWPEGVVVVRADAGRCEVHPTGVSPTTEWRRTVQAVVDGGQAERRGAPDQEILVAPGVQPRGGASLRRENEAATARWKSADAAEEVAPDTAIRLDNDQATESFLRQWVEALDAQQPPTPVIRKPKVAGGPWLQIAVGTAAALLVAAVVSLGYVQDQTALQELRAQVQHVVQGQSELTKLKTASRNLEKDRDRLTRELEEFQSELQRAVRDREKELAKLPPGCDMRSNISALLDALGHSANGELVIQSVTAQSPSHLVEGVARSSQAATRYAEDIEKALSQRWIVHLPEIEPVLGSQFVAWRFKVLVEPINSKRSMSEETQTRGGWPWAVAN